MTHNNINLQALPHGTPSVKLKKLKHSRNLILCKKCIKDYIIHGLVAECIVTCKFCKGVLFLINGSFK